MKCSLLVEIQIQFEKLDINAIEWLLIFMNLEDSYSDSCKWSPISPDGENSVEIPSVYQGKLLETDTPIQNLAGQLGLSTEKE